MRNIYDIARAELQSLFYSPIAWLILSRSRVPEFSGDIWQEWLWVRSWDTLCRI